MRRLGLAALLMLASAQVFAREATSEIKDIAAIQPLQATAQQVEQKLGKPDKVDKGLGQMMWYYNDQNSSLAIMWDMQTSKVMKYAFSSQTGKDDEWNAKDAQKLITGTTSIDNTIELLGTPNNLAVDKNTQQMQYVYRHHTIMLRFLDGKLKEYLVTDTSHK